MTPPPRETRAVPDGVTSRSRLLLTLVALCLSGISAAAVSLVSVEEEIAIGKQADIQVRKDMPVLRNADVTAYVRDIGQRLVRAAPGPHYPYRFAVVDAAEFNAFALPGGPVWINHGVLNAATRESQVASVLAHEIAHIAMRQSADQLTKTMVARWGLGFLGAILGNIGPARSAQAAAALLANGVFMKFSRDDESEADRVGLRMMTRAGWDGRGMVEMFEILRHEAGRNPGMVEAFFSSHPSPDDRIRALRTMSDARRVTGTRDSTRFHTMQTRLRKLSPPPRARRP